jgi:acylphosphatase
VTAVRAVVHGRVQGVGFRWAVREAARTAGATGWVRNRDDGTVEAHVEGDESAVESVMAFLGEGPQGAQVERVERDDAAAEDPGEFGIR